MTAAGRPAPAYTYATMFGLAKEIGLTPEETKLMAYDLTGRDSLKKMTPEELNGVCRELMIRKDGNIRQRGRATGKQLFKIHEYERLLGWDGSPARLAGFISERYHVDRLEWLTPSIASKVIDGMKKIYEREKKKEADADG